MPLLLQNFLSQSENPNNAVSLAKEFAVWTQRWEDLLQKYSPDHTDQMEYILLLQEFCDSNEGKPFEPILPLLPQLVSTNATLSKKKPSSFGNKINVKMLLMMNFASLRLLNPSLIGLRDASTEESDSE